MQDNKSNKANQVDFLDPEFEFSILLDQHFRHSSHVNSSHEVERDLLTLYYKLGLSSEAGKLTLKQHLEYLFLTNHQFSDYSEDQKKRKYELEMIINGESQSRYQLPAQREEWQVEMIKATERAKYHTSPSFSPKYCFELIIDFYQKVEGGPERSTADKLSCAKRTIIKKEIELSNLKNRYSELLTLSNNQFTDADNKGRPQSQQSELVKLLLEIDALDNFINFLKERKIELEQEQTIIKSIPESDNKLNKISQSDLVNENLAGINYLSEGIAKIPTSKKKDNSRFRNNKTASQCDKLSDIFRSDDYYNKAIDPLKNENYIQFIDGRWHWKGISAAVINDVPALRKFWAKNNWTYPYETIETKLFKMLFEKEFVVRSLEIRNYNGDGSSRSIRAIEKLYKVNLDKKN